MNDLVVERLLPPDFFEKLGRYVATCGHIEETVWRIIVQSSGLDLATRNGLREAKVIRDSTGTLVHKFGEIAKRQAEPIRSTMLDMASRMSADERGPRNLAVHGAWRWDPTAQTYRVCSSKALSDALEYERQPTADAVPQDELDEALVYVDRVLQHLCVSLSASSCRPVHPIRSDGLGLVFIVTGLGASR